MVKRKRSIGPARQGHNRTKANLSTHVPTAVIGTLHVPSAFFDLAWESFDDLVTAHGVCLLQRGNIRFRGPA